jgi:exopolyphosphatase/guanosine-5'-triphosphate,3'-diphosphate pyrophosphatase
MPGSGRKLLDGDLLAAVDLGSNSYHMVVAQYVLGQIRVVDRLRETVRMAEGLNGKGGLDAAVMQRALDTLSRFGQRLRALPMGRVRAIATNSVRQLAHPQSFLIPAETALGHGIEVVSGREEARLIYLGVAHATPPGDGRRLVMDIGGGSTEFIIGEGFETIERESLQVGCVATTRRFFRNGKLGRKRWHDALTEVSAEFQQFAAAYRQRGWQQALGASGTIKAIGQVSAAMRLGKGTVTAEAVAEIRTQLLKFPRIDDIVLPGLSAERRPVFAGGLLILEAAFNELGLRQLHVSKNAMREGVLYDMIGRGTDQDPRNASIRALALRYGADQAQAERVENTALRLFDQVGPAWALGEDMRRMLAWACRVHEIGLAIAHSQYHQHSAYVIEHSDIAGFSRQEQQLLAALVRSQRRSVAVSVLQALPERLSGPALLCLVPLRLAVLLHRSHDPAELPDLSLEADGLELRLGLPRKWLESHRLTGADLETEVGYLADAGLTLSIDPG